MALNRERGLQESERLLKQGRVQAALTELQRLAVHSPNDVSILNRLGDLLARQGRTDEAIQEYEKIAQEFKQGGFLPKAVAIYKKMLRLDPQRPGTLFELGNLFLSRELVGEARGFLLRAAEIHLNRQDLAKARKVYERLVEAEPDDPRHRARLAETRAAQGDAQGAANELVRLGGSLQAAGKLEEAERTFRRAAELWPGRPEPVIGIAKCLSGLGRRDEALHWLERHAGGGRPEPEVLGELAEQYQEAGRGAKALEILLGPLVDAIPEAVLEKVMRSSIQHGQAEALWASVDPVLERWSRDGRSARLAALLDRLATMEPGGHLPALERLVRVLRGEGGRGADEALERLVGAYESRGMAEHAAQAREELRKNRRATPRSGAAEEPGVTGATGRGPRSAPRTLETSEEAARVDVLAVPVSRADEEFVTGRLTQAEIFEKYGLEDQALEQLREVTERFPGHVEAQDRLVVRLRTRNDTTGLRDALVALALARHAAGDLAGARAAARRAEAQQGLDPAVRSRLERLALLGGEAAPAAGAGDRASGARAPGAGLPGAGTSEVVIDFELGDEESTEVAEAPPVISPPRRERRTPRYPDPGLLEELEERVRSGDLATARERVQALRTLGYEGAELDRLESACAAASTPLTRSATRGEFPEPGLDDDDDLTAVTAALERELAEAFGQPAVPEGEAQESLEDIFAAFKRRVQDEVGAHDFRTRYDLGIAYKEMGLVDDAIGEFEAALRDPELHGLACSMLALCHRGRGDMVQAARWYREALGARGLDEEALRGLRYDLAEVLLGGGDAEGALDLFQQVLASDPAYRDVQRRVTELEGRLRP